MSISPYASLPEERPSNRLVSTFNLELNEPDVYALSLDKGEFIYMASQPLSRSYEITQGFVKLSQYSDTGKETILALLKPGDMLGNLIPSNVVAHEHAQAMTKVVMKVYEAGIFGRAVRYNPNFALKVLTAYQNRNLLFQRQMASRAFLDVNERIQKFLLFLGREYGRVHGQTAFLENFLTHHDISLINQTSRQSASMVLSRMKSAGIIHYDRYQLIIHLDKLQASLPISQKRTNNSNHPSV